MSKIAVSDDPVYITKGRPYSVPMTWSDVDNSAVNINGFTITAALIWGKGRQTLSDGTQKPSVIQRSPSQDALGKFIVTGTVPDTTDMPLGSADAILLITITDLAGNLQDCVYPVVGELP